MPVFKLLKSPKMISHKIWVAENFLSFYWFSCTGWVLWRIRDPIRHTSILSILSTEHSPRVRPRLPCRVFGTRTFNWRAWSQSPGSSLTDRGRRYTHCQHSWYCFSCQEKITSSREYQSPWTLETKMVLWWQATKWQNEDWRCQYSNW